MKNNSAQETPTQNTIDAFNVTSPLEKKGADKNAQNLEPEIITKCSLKEFIDDYQKLLSIVGFFAAFGLIWKQLVDTKPLNYISYLCFLITACLLFEVFKGFKKLDDSPNGVIFKTLFYAVFLALVMNLIFSFPENFKTIIIDNIEYIATVLIVFAGEYVINLKRKSLSEQYAKDIESLSNGSFTKESSERNLQINRDYLSSELRLSFMEAAVVLIAFIIGLLIHLFWLR